MDEEGELHQEMVDLFDTLVVKHLSQAAAGMWLDFFGIVMLAGTYSFGKTAVDGSRLSLAEQTTAMPLAVLRLLSQRLRIFASGDWTESLLVTQESVDGHREALEALPSSSVLRETRRRALLERRQLAFPEIEWPPRIGALGGLPYNRTLVFQVVGKTKLLVAFPDAGFGFQPSAVLEGLPTNNVTDESPGQVVQLVNSIACWKAVGTTTYTTVTGGSRTVQRLVLFNADPVVKYLRLRHPLRH